MVGSRSNISTSRERRCSLTAPLAEARTSRHWPPVRPGQSATSPATYATRACKLAASCHGSPPNSSARPPVARIRPSTILIVVDLPAPLGPRKPWTSPAVTSRSRPSRARTGPKVLTSSSIRITGCAVVMGTSVPSREGRRRSYVGIRMNWNCVLTAAWAQLSRRVRRCTIPQLPIWPNTLGNAVVAGRRRVVGNPRRGLYTTSSSSRTLRPFAFGGGCGRARGVYGDGPGVCSGPLSGRRSGAGGGECDS